MAPPHLRQWVTTLGIELLSQLKNTNFQAQIIAPLPQWTTWQPFVFHSLSDGSLQSSDCFISLCWVPMTPAIRGAWSRESYVFSFSSIGGKLLKTPRRGISITLAIFSVESIIHWTILVESKINLFLSWLIEKNYTLLCFVEFIYENIFFIEFQSYVKKVLRKFNE